MTLHLPKEKSYVPVVVLISCVAVGFIGLSIFSILRNRQSYLNEARIKSKAQAQLLAENTSGAIYAADLTLLSLRSMVRHQDSDIRSLSIPAVQFIESELKFLPQIKNIVFLDSKGEVNYSSAESKKFALPSFSEHRDAWLDFSVDTVTAVPAEAKIVLSRRIENQNAEFIGALAAVVDPDFFYARYNDYLNIDVDAIALLDMRGSVLTSWFRDADPEKKFVGADLQTLPHFSSFSGPIPSSGGLRTLESGVAIVSTYQLPGFPFHVAVSYSKNNILQKWRREANRDIAIIFFTTLIAAVTMTLAYRHRQRRKKAESELQEYQARLEEMVENRTRQLSETNRELVQKNEAIAAAMAEVKTLSGLLPICSHCKKIRDDKGYWNQIEAYIHKHSGAEFSHGICPECARKFYPEFNLYDKD